MPGYILTGPPGAGKTAVLRQLEINGHVVVEEAATDVIALDNALGLAEPRRDHTFIDTIVSLQRQRQSSLLAAASDTVFFDRNQGFVRATTARRISFEDSLAFEQLHEQAYRDIGFRLVEVPAGPLTERVTLVQQTVERLRR
jgi:predicted ATPase